MSNQVDKSKQKWNELRQLVYSYTIWISVWRKIKNSETLIMLTVLKISKQNALQFEQLFNMFIVFRLVLR